MIWQLSLRSLLPRRYEMGMRYFEGDEKLRGNTVQADARAVYRSGDTTAPGRRSMFIACASK